MTPRTWLYVPGDRPDLFDKAVAAGADAVVIDLEDSVTVERKTFAREQARAFLSHEHAVPMVVRVNEVPGLGLEDLEALQDSCVAWVRIPKVEEPEQLEAVRQILPRVRQQALIESARGVSRLSGLAACPMVDYLGLGEADLMTDLRAEDRTVLDLARVAIVYASRAAAIEPPIMAVYPFLSRDAEFEAELLKAASRGFGSCSVIHPNQVPVGRRAFAPDAGSLDRANQVLATLADVQASGSGGYLTPDGEYLDTASIRRARQLIDRGIQPSPTNSPDFAERPGS